MKIEAGICPLPLFTQVKPLEQAVRKQHGPAGSMLHVSLIGVLPTELAIIAPQREDRKLSCAAFGHDFTDMETLSSRLFLT